MIASTPDTLADRFARVRATIATSCEHANRPVESVTLLAVSKTRPAEMLVEAVACGQTHFGENRIEEASLKIPQVEANINGNVALTWHMIGHIQSRKVQPIIQQFDVIHSLDSVKLAERSSRFAVEAGKMVTVLLEMNVSGEASKDGFSATNWRTDRIVRETLWNDIRRIIELPGLNLTGLMTMAPIVDEVEQVRPIFRELRLLRDALAADFSQLTWDTLSMGMTDDYRVAIEEGSTIVRIGRALFGERV